MTRHGWSILALAVALWIWARTLGIGELIQVGLALTVLCVSASVWVRVRNRDLRVSRSFSKTRVHRENPLQLTIRIHNLGGAASPELSVEEPLPGSSSSLRTEIPPLLPGEYELHRTVHFNRRGRYSLEQLTVTLADPYGVVRSKRKFSDPVSLVVYPKVETLSTPDRIPFSHSNSLRRAPGLQGEDFYGVREYRPGDDPRRIHWPTSARLGTLMIREEEVSGRDRVTIVLDDRAAAHTPQTFDWAADAAASVVDLYLRMGLTVRLARAGGGEIPPGRGALHYLRMMEELAVAALQPASVARMHALMHRGNDDVLALVAGEIGPETFATLTKVSGRYREVIVIFPPGLEVLPRYVALLRDAGARIVAVREGEELTHAWDASLGTAWATESVPT